MRQPIRLPHTPESFAGLSASPWSLAILTVIGSKSERWEEQQSSLPQGPTPPPILPSSRTPTWRISMRGGGAGGRGRPDHLRERGFLGGEGDVVDPLDEFAQDRAALRHHDHVVPLPEGNPGAVVVVHLAAPPAPDSRQIHFVA